MAGRKKRADERFTRTLTIDGRRVFVYGSTDEEAEAKWLELKQDVLNGLKYNPRKAVDEWLLAWFDLYKRDRGALKTQEMYKYAINNFISPAIGHKLLVEVKQQDIQLMMNQIKQPAAARIVLMVIRQVFQAAVTNKHRRDNPVVDIVKVTKRAPKREFFDDAHRTILIEATRGKRHWPYVMTLLYAGLRRGEVLALLKSDVDFEQQVLHITKGVEFEGVAPKGKGPKSEAGHRDIPIPDELVEPLRMQMAASSSVYLFPGPSGGMHTRTSIDNYLRAIQRAVDTWFRKRDKAERKRLEKQGLNAEQIDKEMDKLPKKFQVSYRRTRHTYATGLYDAGVDLKVAQYLMGHADIKITMNVYTHIAESRRRGAVAKLNNLYKRKNEPLCDDD